MVRSKLICLAVLLLAVSILNLQQASAQAVYGSILGTVTDAQGAVVPGAKITATNTGQGTTETTTSNESGNYTVNHLIAGTYSVKFEATGFKSSETKDVSVLVDAGARVDGRLEVGQVTETVEVTAEAPQLKTDRADVATTFNETYVKDLPILNRNFTTLQLLAPGSQKLVGWSHAATENPQGGQQIFSQGQHFSGTGFELDGTDNQDPILGIIVINPHLDSVTEAKIALQNYDAEFGKAVASLVTAVTKSGSNQVHGSGFYFDRRSKFQARDPFTQPKSVPNAKWQQFGGSIGGAIIKDKLFFFGDYQGTRQTAGVTSQFTIPTAEVLSTCNPATNATSATPGFCDLSQYSAPGSGVSTGGQAYDPVCPVGTVNITCFPLTGNGRSAFAGNMIPINRISPAAANILALFPAPQNTSLFNNYLASGSGPFSENGLDTRIDFAASQSLSVFGRFSLERYSLTGKGLLGALGGSGSGLLGLAGGSNIHNTSLAVGFNKTVSSSILTDFRFGYFKYNPQATKPDGGAPMTALGIPNANLATDPRTAGLGGFYFDGVLSAIGDGLGVARCNCPLTESEQQFQFVNNWTKVLGNHQFKVGGDVRYAENLRLPSDNNRTGEYYFNHQATSSGGTGGLDLASFLLGQVTNLQRYVNNPASGGSPAERQKRLFFYGQDTWRVTPKLTVNYGVRWELYTPEAVNGKGAGGFANIVDNGGMGGIRVGGYGPYNLSGNITNDFKAFAPRLGVAYQLTPKTVVRMGYGRSFDIGVFGSNFGHTVTQNLPVLLKQNLKASSITSGATDDVVALFVLDSGPIAPNFGGPIPSNGFIPLTPQLSGTHLRPIKQVLPTVDAWNATVQRQVSNTISVEFSYVGSKGTHGFAGNGPNYDVNPVTAGPGANVVKVDPNDSTNHIYDGFKATLPQTARRPLCGTYDPAGQVCSKIGFDLGNYYGNDAGSNYNAFEAKVDKRFSQGLQFLAHYTYSHANNYDNNYYAISHRISFGPVDFNRNSVFVVNTVYELPFGRGKKYGSNISKGVDYVAGGWQITNTTNRSSGLPWTPSFGDCNSLQDAGICRPNISGSFKVGAGKFDPSTHTVTYFNPVASLSLPNANTEPLGTDGCSLAPRSAGPFSSPVCGTIGNVRRNSFHGPAGFYSDLSVSKAFTITEKVKAKFAMDAFNVFNHPVYNFSANSGANPCIDCQGGNNGKITDLENGTSMRALEFSIRVDF